MSPFLSGVVHCVFDFWSHSRKAFAARRDATFLGHGASSNGHKEFLGCTTARVVAYKRRTNRVRTKRSTVSAGGQPARLDESVEVAAIEKQPTDAGQCDSRQRPALDQVADGPGADTEVAGCTLDVQQARGVDGPTGYTNQRDGCAFARFRVDVTRDVTRSWLRSCARAARTTSKANARASEGKRRSRFDRLVRRPHLATRR